MSQTSGCSGNCSSCGSASSCSQKPQHEKTNEFSNVKKVIGVVSGKGGVGKSFITGSLAVLMRRKGYEVGILDADITGPSIPKMFGINKRAEGSDIGIMPALSDGGIKIMSVNLLLESADTPVIWRGPVIAGAVKQFWTDVVWGDTDYMFVDMPPGTGDVPLTVFQSLPLDGIVVVASPQELVGMIVEKAVNMAKMMNIPVLGIVENMSYFECPDCGGKHRIFGDNNLDDVAEKYDIETVSKIPINSKLAAACDKGMIELFSGDWLENLADKINNL